VVVYQRGTYELLNMYFVPVSADPFLKGANNTDDRIEWQQVRQLVKRDGICQAE
jgi:hypothetical protein